MTIKLGSHDPGIAEPGLSALIERMRHLSGDSAETLRDDKGPAPFAVAAPAGGWAVADVQRFLTGAGFLPGGQADGICGYRTRAAIRLFQEHVRSVEGRPCMPDGTAGPKTRAEMVRWRDSGQRASWVSGMAGRADGAPGERGGDGTDEWRHWLGFLDTFKARHLDLADPVFSAVERFDGPSDTRRVADWRFGADELHLIGIRYGEAIRQGRGFDDVLVLLVKGLVFTFQGSTDPGATSHPDGAPFMVRGQHDFRLGLHRGRYHALRPSNHATHGVLVVRSKDGLALDVVDPPTGLAVNGTINIHWGGIGLRRNVSRWSEGCQVVNGAGYRNHAGDIVDCTDHVAINNGEVADPDKRKTRGAYNVLSDLIVAMSSGMADPGTVRYTLLHGSDLAIDPVLAERMSELRADAWRRITETG